MMGYYAVDPLAVSGAQSGDVRQNEPVPGVPVANMTGAPDGVTQAADFFWFAFFLECNFPPRSPRCVNARELMPGSDIYEQRKVNCGLRASTKLRRMHD